jgi:hypothetical protein
VVNVNDLRSFIKKYLNYLLENGNVVNDDYCRLLMRKLDREGNLSNKDIEFVYKFLSNENRDFIGRELNRFNLDYDDLYKIVDFKGYRESDFKVVDNKESKENKEFKKYKGKVFIGNKVNESKDKINNGECWWNNSEIKSLIYGMDESKVFVSNEVGNRLSKIDEFWKVLNLIEKGLEYLNKIKLYRCKKDLCLKGVLSEKEFEWILSELCKVKKVRVMIEEGKMNKNRLRKEYCWVLTYR